MPWYFLQLQLTIKDSFKNDQLKMPKLKHKWMPKNAKLNDFLHLEEPINGFFFFKSVEVIFYATKCHYHYHSINLIKQPLALRATSN